MTSLDAWLESARRDADRRQLPALVPLLETLSRSTAVLRATDWNEDAADRAEPVEGRDTGTGDTGSQSSGVRR